MAFNLGNILYFAVLSGFLANAYAAITMLPDGSGNGYTVEPRQFLWIVVLEVIVTFTTAFGIGANDCANSFGTSVGSGALTLRSAVVIAATFEFLGAFLMGSQVTDTVRKKVVDVAVWEDNPAIIMVGMLAADLATSIWLFLATKWSLPVSTTHSIIGALVGFGLAAGGVQAVFWDKLIQIVMSWFTAPLAAACVAGTFFVIIRATILRQPNSYNRARWAFPFLLSLTLWVNFFFFMYKGTPQLADTFEPLGIGGMIGIGLGAGVAVAIPVWLVWRPFQDRKVERQALELEQKKANKEMREDYGYAGDAGVGYDYPSMPDPSYSPYLAPATYGGSMPMIPAPNPLNLLVKLNNHLTRDLTAEGTEEPGWMAHEAKHVHDSAEKFDLRTELQFNFAQVITACFDSFSHGANDVANAIATCAATVQIYNDNAYVTKSEIPLWILGIGGAGIAVGLATWGWKIIKVIGVQLTAITPCRGFCIELSSAFTVITCSALGAPVSTTHCQVGATLGVGIVEGRRDSVNWKFMGIVFMGWVGTVIFTGLLSAALVSLAIYSPQDLKIQGA